MNAHVSYVCDRDAVRLADLLLHTCMPLLAIRNLRFRVDGIERCSSWCAGRCTRVNETVRHPVKSGRAISRIIEGPIVNRRSVCGQRRRVRYLRSFVVDAIAAVEHSFGCQFVREADARRDIRVVAADSTCRDAVGPDLKYLCRRSRWVEQIHAVADLFPGP